MIQHTDKKVADLINHGAHLGATAPRRYWSDEESLLAALDEGGGVLTFFESEEEFEEFLDKSSGTLQWFILPAEYATNV